MKNIDFTDFLNVFLSGATISGRFYHLKRRRAKQCRPSPRRCFLESVPSPQSAASEAMPPMRRQSAAKLPSLAPHGVGRGCNMNRHAEDSWRSHVHRTSTAQRVQPFKPKSCNVGGRGERPSPFSGGSKGGILFGKRIPPLSGSSAKSCTNSCSATRCNLPPSRRGKIKRQHRFR